jgi:hypothetical protein
MTAQEALELARLTRDDQSIHQAAERILTAYYKGVQDTLAEQLELVLQTL